MDLGMKLDVSLPLLQKTGNIGGNKGEPIEKTAEQFESFLIFSVLKEFEKSMSLTKKGYAEQMQMSMFFEKVADSLARKGIGIKEVIARYAEAGAAKVPETNGEKSSQEVPHEDRQQ